MSKDLIEEKKLTQLLKEGDKEAFVSLYNTYHEDLYSYVLRFIKIPAIAEDIIQDVFLKIWEIRQRINPELSFNGYLYRISRNNVFKLMKEIASSKQLRLQVLDQLSITEEQSDFHLQWQQYEIMLKAAIDHLPSQRQKVFKLCRQEAKKYDEVAAELNISRNTVKEHMVLATRFIRDYLHRHSGILVSQDHINMKFVLVIFLADYLSK